MVQSIRKQAWALWKCHKNKCLAFCKKHKFKLEDVFLGKDSFNNDGEIIEYSVCLDYNLEHCVTDGVDAKAKDTGDFWEIKSKKVTAGRKIATKPHINFNITFTNGHGHERSEKLIDKLTDPKTRYWLLVRATSEGETIIDVRVLIKDTEIIDILRSGKRDAQLKHYVSGRSFKVLHLNKTLYEKFVRKVDSERLQGHIDKFLK